MSSTTSSSSEVPLNPLHILPRNLEGLLQDLLRKPRVRPEQCRGGELCPGILAVEPRQHHRRRRRVKIVQEVDQPPGEQERIAGTKLLGVEAVWGVDEAYQQRPPEEQRCLGSAGVGVGRDEAAADDVDTGHRQALRVGAGECGGVGGGDAEAEEGSGGGNVGLGERGGGEVGRAGEGRIDAGATIEVEGLGSDVGDAIVEKEVGIRAGRREGE